jgi:hypothetical protein
MDARAHAAILRRTDDLAPPQHDPATRRAGKARHDKMVELMIELHKQLPKARTPR